MRERISWSKTIMTTIGAQIICFVVFLMLEVFWADLIKDYLTTLYIGGIYTTSFLVLLIGIFINFLISIIVYTIFIKNNKLLVFGLCMASMLLTSLTLVFISSTIIEYEYSEIFAGYTIFEKIQLFPQYVTFYAIYILESPVLLWDITSLIFGLFMLILIRLFVYEVRTKKKVKPLLERII